MKNILCYGDSNTWGFIAGSINFESMYMERYPRHIRWTGVLQNLLGDNYYVIEEGLNGRTTNIDYKEVFGPKRNGKPFLSTCLYTHAPLDLIILMLGANDLKKEFNRTSQEIAAGLKELVEIIHRSTFGHDMQSPPKILLVSPPIPVNETYAGDMMQNSIPRAKEFSKEFKKIADAYDCYFLDAAPHVQLSDIDGIHFDEKAHQDFAKIVYDKVKKIQF